MRTVVNIRAGGRTPVSGALHALVLLALALALGLGPVVSHVPHAVLAAILLKVGWEIIDWGYLERLRQAPREDFVIMLVTLGLTVFVDLIIAVAVGIILSAFVSARWIAEEQLAGFKQSTDGEEIDQLTDEEKAILRTARGKVLIMLLQGYFSYVSARELSRRAFSGVAHYKVVIFDFSNSGYLDTSSALAVDDMVISSFENNQRVIICGVRGRSQLALEGMGVLGQIPAEDQFDNRLGAIKAAVAIANNDIDGAT